MRNGKYNNIQRYKCKKCSKTFTDFTNSPIYNSKKTKSMD
ncbi:IS1/IS1595 family N-terminal zinc-binding domain-containing protein [Clostridium gasigenes]